VSFALLVAVLVELCVRLDWRGGAIAVVALAAAVRCTEPDTLQ